MIEAAYANGRVTTGRPPLISPSGLRVAQWTEADQAEHDVIADAIVSGYLEHRDRCRACAARRDGCARLAELVADWRTVAAQFFPPRPIRYELDDIALWAMECWEEAKNEPEEAKEARRQLVADTLEARGRVMEHLDTCETCRTPACPALGVAVEALTDWRRSRALRSRAVALRAEQQAREWLNEAAA